MKIAQRSAFVVAFTAMLLLPAATAQASGTEPAPPPGALPLPSTQPHPGGGPTKRPDVKPGPPQHDTSRTPTLSPKPTHPPK
jgi:hypothetical protein